MTIGVEQIGSEYLMANKCYFLFFIHGFDFSIVGILDPSCVCLELTRPISYNWINIWHDSGRNVHLYGVSLSNGEPLKRYLGRLLPLGLLGDCQSHIVLGTMAQLLSII